MSKELYKYIRRELEPDCFSDTVGILGLAPGNMAYDINSALSDPAVARRVSSIEDANCAAYMTKYQGDPKQPLYLHVVPITERNESIGNEFKDYQERSPDGIIVFFRSNSKPGVVTLYHPGSFNESC